MINLKEAGREGIFTKFHFQESIQIDKLREAVDKDGYFFLDTEKSIEGAVHVLTKESRILFATIKLEGNTCKSLLFINTPRNAKLVNKFEDRIPKALAAIGKTQNFKEKSFHEEVPLGVLQEAAKAIKGCSVKVDAKEGDKLHILKGGEFVATVEVKNGLCHRIRFADTKENTGLLKNLRENITKAMSTLKGIEKITAPTKNTPATGNSVINTDETKKIGSQIITPFQRKIRLGDMRRAAEMAGYAIVTRLKQAQVFQNGAEKPIGRLVLNRFICEGITNWTDENAVNEFGRKIAEALKQLELKQEFRELFDKDEIDRMRNIGKLNYSKDTGTLSIGPTNQIQAHIILRSIPGICEKLGQERKEDVRMYYVLGQAEKPLLVIRHGKQGKQEYVILTFTNVPQNKEFVLDCVRQLSKN